MPFEVSLLLIGLLGRIDYKGQLAPMTFDDVIRTDFLVVHDEDEVVLLQILRQGAEGVVQADFVELSVQHLRSEQHL